MNTQNKFEIFVPSSRTFLVYCNGKEVKNWRELEAEARQAAEPQILDRWEEYWVRLLARFEAWKEEPEKVTLDEFMWVPTSPNMYYECPEELAAKAVL
jgi:hypothetical protein